jgi:2-oxoisovalerate dehydrogenase E1 component alpha subunit
VALETPAAAGSELLCDWEHLYRAMRRGRRFDELALALQRQGVIDSYGESRGQEGAQIGAVIDLEPGDMVFPSYRQPSVGLLRGVTMVELLSHYAGLGYCTWNWRRYGFGPYCIPVGSQTAHATGWAWAARLRGEPSATVVFLGEGAASQGEVHEAMNFAGVFGAPVVFVIENNGWAISLPVAQQTRAEGLYLRAAGYGIHGARVDGNDVLAVRAEMRAALARARGGEGPTLLEAVTYRMGGHTTSDDPKRYRTEEELAGWRERDPIARLQQLVGDRPGARERMEEIDREVDAELKGGVDEFLELRGMT